MRLIQERQEGERIPQGLSLTKRPSGYRRYVLRLWDIKASLSLCVKSVSPSLIQNSAFRRFIFSLDTVTLKDPEFPGVRMTKNLLELSL